MDRRGRGRGFAMPPGVPRRLIPPHGFVRTTEGVCGTQPPAADDQAGMQDAGKGTEEQRPDQYDATLEDVKETKMLLTAKGLPWEIVNIIMDKAEYWVLSESSLDYRQLTGTVKRVSGGTPSEDSFMIRCPPIGLTKWAPPASDAPEYKLWWDTAAKPKLATEHDEAPDPSSGDKQHSQDSNPKTHTESSPQASGGHFARQIYFDKETLEKLTDIPVPTLENPVRKIVFDIVSGDQGHGGHEDGARPDAPYDNSHTWFDAGVDRFDKSVPHPAGIKDDDILNRIHPSMIRPVWPRSKAVDINNNNSNAWDDFRRPVNQSQGPIVYHHDLHPTRKHVIQFNKRAQREPQQHHVEWSWLDGSVSEDEDLGFVGHAPNGNGDFVRSLRLGDMVTIWGRARYGGWINNVIQIHVKIYYAA